MNHLKIYQKVNHLHGGAEVSNFREKAVASSPVEDEEDALSYFSKLAEEE